MHLVCKNCPKETVLQYMKKGVPLLMSDKVKKDYILIRFT